VVPRRPRGQQVASAFFASGVVLPRPPPCRCLAPYRAMNARAASSTLRTGDATTSIIRNRICCACAAGETLHDFALGAIRRRERQDGRHEAHKRRVRRRRYAYARMRGAYRCWNERPRRSTPRRYVTGRHRHAAAVRATNGSPAPGNAVAAGRPGLVICQRRSGRCAVLSAASHAARSRHTR